MKTAYNSRFTRRQFIKAAGAGIAAGAISPLKLTAEIRPKSNFLLITADDLNWDSPGCFGGKTPDITPNIDRLAASGMRFDHGHVTIAVCQPSRSVLMTGRYPHRNGAEGFQPIDTSITTLQETLHDAGYLNGILGKGSHLAPKEKFKWDMYHDMGELGHGRDPGKYYQFASEFLKNAAKQNKSFFLMANSHDPHRPFHGSAQEKAAWPDAANKIPAPSRIYGPADVDVPDFLPDIPQVRKEIAEYYCSVRRCDDTVGAVMKALRESGLAENTLIMFLSDNGMALPFAKTNCYLNSTKTPWIASWPGKIKAGSVDKRHFISAIDFMPTVLDVAALEAPNGMDGVTFAPVLRGKRQSGRKYVFTQFHQTSGKNRYPIRCTQDRRYGYIFNPWADGQRIFKNESQSGLSFKAMQAAAETDSTIAARVKLFRYRVLEEFYDLVNDPGALVNLAKDARYTSEIDRLRNKMLEMMKQSNDSAYKALANRNSPEALKQFMAEQEARSGKKKRNAKKKPTTSKKTTR